MKKEKKHSFRKNKINDEIEIIDDDEKSKKKNYSKSILLIISCLLLVLSLGICGYLYYKNTTLEKEVNDAKTNITKVQEKIDNNKKEIDEQEN